MEAASLPEYYTEVIPLTHTEPAKFLAAAQKATAHLRWLSGTVDANTVICQTPATEYSQNEIITITAKDKIATLHCKPSNEYYWDREQSRNNTELLKRVIAKVLEAEETNDRNMHPMNREKYGALVPSKSYVVTPLLIYANVLVFVAMVLVGISPTHPTAKSLFDWGGNLRQAVDAGEWWRLFTYMFLHGGAAHILGNIFALLYVGMFLEPLVGKFRFLAAYLLTGICAGVVSILVHSNSVGVGASGAIFGLYGVFLSMLTTSYIKKTMRQTMLRSMLFFVVYSLMMGLQGNTDNAAHIGGLISGFAIGYVFFPGVAKHASVNKQLITTAVLAVAVVLLSVGALHFF